MLTHKLLETLLHASSNALVCMQYVILPERNTGEFRFLRLNTKAISILGDQLEGTLASDLQDRYNAFQLLCQRAFDSGSTQTVVWRDSADRAWHLRAWPVENGVIVALDPAPVMPSSSTWEADVHDLQQTSSPFSRNTFSNTTRSEDPYGTGLLTELTKTGLDLNESKKLLQTIFDNSPNALGVFETLRNEQGQVYDFIVRMFNSAAIRVLEKPDAIGKRYTECFPHHKETSIFKRLLRLVNAGQAAEFEKYYEVADSWWRFIVNQVGELVLVTSEDITKRKKAEEEIIQQAHLIHSITNTIGDIVSVVEHPSNRIDYVNKASFSLLAFDPDENPLSANSRGKLLHHPEDAGIITDYYQRFASLKDGEDNYMEYRARGKHGEWIWLGVRGRVFRRNDQGQVTYSISIAHNITERKKTEQELMDLKLQGQKDILNAIIMTQEEERERIGEALHNGVAQLLYGIQIRLQALDRYSEHYDAQLRELLKLVSDTINDTRKISFELVPVVLRDYGIEVALKSLFQRISIKHISLDLNVHDLKRRLPEKIEFAIYRIVQELVNNIQKHSRATQASVHILVKRKYLHLVVRDNGVGFHEDQLNPMTKGIGIQSVKNRVRLMEGSIKIKSGEGGTSVEIRVPVRK